MSVRFRPLSSLLLAAALAAVPAAVASPAAAAPSPYRVGVGIADITGEAAELGMLGYADPAQTTAGIHTRQWSRAFAIAAGPAKVALVSTDLDFVSQSVHTEVVRRLAGTGYTATNLVLTATHTHSAPAGYTHSTLYNLTTLGFEKRTFEAIVAGIVRSVRAADADLAPGAVKIAAGTLAGANVNRSLPAFQRNSAADRARFPGAVDNRMTVLRFEQAGTPVGMMSWFPTHGTSMRPDNRLISGDNKGYAAQHTEHSHGVTWSTRGAFVAAFAQTAAGDMSPNLRDGGAAGPTDDQFENTRIIGDLQATAAQRLFDAATEELTGPLDVRQRYVDFSGVQVRLPDGSVKSTCPGALGQNFTAGAEDGPGPDIVDEGDLTTNPLLLAAGIVVNPATPAVRACHAPKQVFLATGLQNPPWTPQVMPLQVVRIGQLAVTVAPGEFTIVAGQKTQDAVAAALGGITRHQILAGYANAYAGYVTTAEEYDAQHYEGAATHFGRYTQAAYAQELAALAAALRTGAATPSAVQPPWLGDRQISVRPGIVFDAPPVGKAFGQVLTQPAASYRRGQTVTVAFATGHPGNNFRNEGTFLEVQRQVAGAWRTVATDDDWSTKYRWARNGLAASTATIEWAVPADAAPGTYRIVHHGDAKSLLGRVAPLTGTSRTFTVS
ncbi:neutral/alkaline ceramidase [Spirilliplanes yamanashiensis]|uniref:Neutral ceramidase n=1 Tax=Spirilliplanes yamanashiensis TaxID=42233 RepID=A0A8J3Y9S9_9ACTN|nr:neutral/alkaline ceramidase [Spirilliplanes yamanashiensis]GIJ03850.1 neutral ceramidase [Spirilliplanes yamanashiensis]